MLLTTPTVASINSVGAAITNASTASWTATFSEPVTGVDPTDFTLVETGTVGTTLTQVTAVSTTVYTVTVSGITGNGTLGLNLVDDGSIHDLAGNSLATPPAAKTVTINVQSPLTAVAVGPETRVNTYTTSAQSVSHVAMDSAGDYVVVWQSLGQDGDSSGIYAQRYNAAGTAQGGEFKVNTYTTGRQNGSSVAMDASGDFVIAWNSYGQDHGGTGIYAQRYNAVGAAQGGEFLVDTNSKDRVNPSVAMDANGDFVVTWMSINVDAWNIYAQRFSAAGVAQGGEFLVNRDTTFGKYSPVAAMDATGDFVITWYSVGQDGSGNGIYAERFNAAGTAQGGEFRVNTYTTGSQTSPSVAMDAAGDFLIAWGSIEDGSGYGVYAQRYNATGTAQGGEFRVNTYTTSNQFFPSVAMDAAGNFVVTWESGDQDGSEDGIYAQRYNAAGTAQGGEFQVNTVTYSRQAYPSVAMDGAGKDFVVTWQSYGQDGSNLDIYSQRYKPVNHSPTGMSMAVTTLEDTGYKLVVGDFGFTDPNDSPANSLLAVEITTLPTTGTLKDNGVAVTAGQFVSAADITGGKLVFIPAANANGANYGNFTFQVQDDGGTANGGADTDPNPKALKINVTTVNDGPVGRSSTMTMLEDNALTIQTANFGFSDPLDTPANALKAVKITTLPLLGLLIDNGTAVTAGQFVPAADIAGGKLIYTSAPNASGIGYANFTFQVQDDGGTANNGVDTDPNPKALTINVTTVNDAPVGTSNAVVTLQNAALTIKAAMFGFTDPLDNPANALNAVEITTLPLVGLLADNGTAVTAGQFVSVADIAGGKLIFTPATNMNGMPYTSFTFQVQDDGGTANGGLNTDPNPKALKVNVPDPTKAPVLSTIESKPLLSSGPGSVALTSTVTLSDAESLNAASATLQITIGYQSGSDSLTFANTAKITGIWNSGSGILTLSGIDTLAGYQAALRSVRFQNTGTNTALRTVTFQVSDGLQNSNLVSRILDESHSAIAAVGFETRVNSYTPNNQRYTAVAMDAAGDYVAVWSSRGQDGSGYGVFAQRYNAAGGAQGGEFKVNTYTTNHQDRPSVAMDAAGDFVVAWHSYSQDGSNSGIYAQRYNAAGVAQGTEFQVNTYTTSTQAYPSVAMDSAGDFVVSWQSIGQDGSGYGIYAQRYNSVGTAQGAEFKVNAFTTGNQIESSVAMDSAGDFVVTWASIGQDGSGYGIYAQRYDALGAAQGGEFGVNTYTTSNQLIPSVAMDAVGDFVISWSSFLQDGSGYGIYAQRYNSAGTAQGAEFKVNTFTAGNQVYPAVAMDAAGDFVITWQSALQEGSSYGIYAQRYNSAGAPVGGEFQVNTYTTGNKYIPAVAMDAAGDFVIAWESSGQSGLGSSGYDVYAQRYVTTVGPIVTAVLEGTGPRVVRSGDKLTSSITTLSVNFSDDLNVIPTGANSVINPSNWRLTRYGVDVSNQISGITFGFNAATNRYVAAVSFVQPLSEGAYQFIARQTIQDLTGRSLDGEADGIPGGDFRRNFYVAKTLTAGSETRVNTYTTTNQLVPSIAMDAAGDYVAAWTSYGQDGSNFGIYAQRYNAAGIGMGGEFRVNTYTNSIQTNPAVAMDAAGDFVITWQSYGQDGSITGVYAKRYNAAGVVQGGEFLVNTYTTGIQAWPSVSMDAAEDFVIAWQSFGQDGSGYGIFAQRYNAAGTAQSGEFRVNTYTTSEQRRPSVAMNAAGEFVIAWNSLDQDGSDSGIYAQRYNAAGIGLGGEFRVNTYTTNTQASAAVAMDAAGDFVISWVSYFQSSQESVYAQRYDSAGIAQGVEFRVNNYTTNVQNAPRVSMDVAGDFVVTWQSGPQVGGDYEIYAQRYNSAGALVGGELRVNSYTTGTQFAPAVAMDAAGDFVISWSSYGQDGSGYGVYSQRYQTDVAPRLSQIEPNSLNVVGPLSTPVNSSLLAFDIDSNNLTGATIQISVNYRGDQDVLAFINTANITGSWNAVTGTLTLSGTDSVSNYRTALRNITYHNTSGSPNTALTRTIDFQATDGLLSSNVITCDLTVQASSTPAVLSGVSGTGTYFEGDPALALAVNLVIADPNTANLASASVAFTNWQGEDRVSFTNTFGLQHTFSQNLVAHTAILTIAGSDTVDHYQTLLRSLIYWDVSPNPVTTARIANITVSDGLSTSNTVTRSTIDVAVNQPPALSAIESTPLAYKANDPAFPALPISGTLLVGDPDSNNLTKATVQITAGYQNDTNGIDLLAFTNQLGIIGSFNAGTATMTLTGTSSVSNYRTALRSVTFSSSGSAVSTANRTLTIFVTDDNTPTHATSQAITRTVSVLTTNIPPGLSGIPTTALAYPRGTTATAVAPGLFVLDPDSINLAGASIQVTGNYQSGQDVLGFATGFGVTGSFAAATGTLTLTGITSLANYQTLLRSVTYKTNTSAASTLLRTISFTVNDGLAVSNPVTRNVALT